MLQQFLKRPVVLLILLGAATGSIAGLVALVNDTPFRAFSVGLAYFCGIALGGWLTMGAVSGFGKLAMRLLDWQQLKIDQVMSDTERAFDRVDALMNTVGRAQVRRRRKSRNLWRPPAFLSALSRFLWKISAYVYSIGVLWTASGLIILVLHRISGLGNSPNLYLLPVGGGLLLTTALATYLSGYLRLWQMMRRSAELRDELLSIEQDLVAEAGNRRR